jgi:hypothetical protein
LLPLFFLPEASLRRPKLWQATALQINQRVQVASSEFQTHLLTLTLSSERRGNRGFPPRGEGTEDFSRERRGDRGPFNKEMESRSSLSLDRERVRVRVT